MFSEDVSIYKDVKDRWGEYHYPGEESQAPTRSMSIGDFLFGGYWQDEVSHLRDMIARLGVADAKNHPEYRATKQQLPGATLSGYFAERRKTDLLTRHSGYICLDIDNQDNTGISDFSQIVFVLRHRPEVACVMRSCSGAGFFALVRLAHPERHKEQFRALYRDYFNMGIHLDRSCSDVTRLRFASFDMDPYISASVVAYEGIDDGSRLLAPRQTLATMQPIRGTNSVEDDVERLVRKIERQGIDITADYHEWVAVGFALATLGEAVGRSYFHRVSAQNAHYSVRETDEKFNSLLHPGQVTIATFFSICKRYGVTFSG